MRNRPRIKVSFILLNYKDFNNHVTHFVLGDTAAYKFEKVLIALPIGKFTLIMEPQL